MKKLITSTSVQTLLFVGAFACEQLQLYEEAIAWCHKGLAVSFDAMLYFLSFRGKQSKSFYLSLL